MSEVVAKVVAKRCLAKKLSKFLKTHTETPALQSLPNKVIGLQAVRLAPLLNRDSGTGASEPAICISSTK